MGGFAKSMEYYDFLFLKTREGSPFLWLRLYAPTAVGQGLIPGQGTRPYMPQLISCIL